MQMKNKAIISGFADEIAPELDTQIKVVNERGISYIEVRGVDGKGIVDYTLEETKEIAERLKKAGVSVSAVGSPIGKIKITDDFEPHMQLFCHTAKQAKILGTKYIRMFSFYIPENEDPKDYREEVLRRLKCMIEQAKKDDVVLLHENEKGIYGDNAERCLDLFKELACDNFRCTFDFANFVQCKQDTLEAYELLEPYIEYIHIKDAIWDSGRVVPAGQGNGHVYEILSKLDKKEYCGFLSLEPHLVDFVGLDNLENGHKEEKEKASHGERAFCLAHSALTELLEKEAL